MENQRNPNLRPVTSAGYFQKLLILFGGILSSQVMMVGVFIYLVVVEGQPTSEELLETMFYVVPAVAVSGFGASFVLHGRMLAKAAEKPNLTAKLQAYQVAFILRLALLEAPAFLGAIAFFLTGSFYFLAVNVVSILLVAMAFPSKERAIDALQLRHDELEKVNDPGAVVMTYEVTPD